jgi:hypothetical protein
VYIKLVVLLRNYVTMMHGQQNIKNGWATIVVVGRLRVNMGRTEITIEYVDWMHFVVIRSSNTSLQTPEAFQDGN